MKVYQDFFSYESGVYRHSDIAEHYDSGYHSVRIIGWGEEPSSHRAPPLKYWVIVYLCIFILLDHCPLLITLLPKFSKFLQLVVNSWGRQWGEDGLFRIQKGTNECDIEAYVLGVWAKTV